MEDPNGNEFAFFTSDSEAGTSPFLRFSVINDTVRFKSFGPWHGKAINLTLSTFPYATGDLGAYNRYSLDFRAYHKLTRRSLVAWRVIGLAGTGDGAPFFSIGGINQLRGFSYREFIGDQAAFSNFELRFPVIDELRFPFGALREIRSWLFFDVGSAWTQDGLFFDRELGFFREFEPYNSEENVLQDVRASYGFGFSVRLGFFNLIWNFAKRLPFSETRASSKCDSSYQNPLPAIPAAAFANCDMHVVKDSGFRSDFYIGFPF